MYRCIVPALSDGPTNGNDINVSVLSIFGYTNKLHTRAYCPNFTLELPGR